LALDHSGVIQTKFLINNKKIPCIRREDAGVKYFIYL
jgi:hypothetical protein